MMFQIFHIHTIIGAGGMNHRPAAEAYANVCDVTRIIIFSQEEQIPNFKWRFDGLRSRVLQICIARNMDPDPVVEQGNKTEAINAIAAWSAPQIRSADHAR